MAELPSGTVTFLFTDIEGSTRLLQRSGAGYGAILARHSDLLGRAVSSRAGHIFGTEGDAVFAAFGRAPDAVAAAVDAQLALAAEPWPAEPVRVRMGIHSGAVTFAGDQYVGLPLHQVARIAAAGHGGQVLVSQATRALVEGELGPDVALRDLGAHRLKDLARAEHLFQVVAPGLADGFPPLRSLEARTTNLPVQVTSFVGREELATAIQVLAGTRILTITGPGGTGKTRLAMQVAADVAGSFADGVFFVALETIRNPDLIAPAIGAAIGVPDRADIPPLSRVIDHLRERRVLLLLDNFEQVLDGARLVSELIQAAPYLTVVVTSRVPLRLYGEHILPLPALRLPIAKGTLTAADAAQSEAVRLFVERAMAVQPAFGLTDANAPAIAEIVARLDGLPLAIELAAARTRVLSIDALRGRLDRALGVLVGGPRDVPSRQQTLRGAIDWSYELLDAPDRRLFERMAVFAAGAGMPEIDSICGPAVELGEDPADGCESLTEKSLLRLVDAGDADRRFGMLVTIQEYAGERLTGAGEADLLRRRHAVAYLALAEQAGPHLTGAPAGRWLNRLEQDHDNLGAAIEWSVTAGETELALKFVAALWRFWQIRGHLFEAQERIARVLAMPGVAEQPAIIRAAALGAAGGIAYWRGNFDATNRWYTAAVEQARASGDQATLAEALYNLGFAADVVSVTQEERYLAGRPSILEGLALFDKLGDARGIANCHWALAIASVSELDHATAREHLAECLVRYRALDDAFGLAWALHLAGLLDRDHDAASSAVAFAEALEIFRRSGDLPGQLGVLADVASLRRAMGDELGFWWFCGSIERLRVETGADLMQAPATSLEWRSPGLPSTAEAKAAWDAGRLCSVDESVEEAFRVLRATIGAAGQPANGTSAT